MKIYLINPRNQIISLGDSREKRWSRFRVWKPLGLLVVAGATPPEWDITILDENVRPQDYASMPLPDVVGITAFTSQASRAYEVAAFFRARGVPVVMGGIHATMCTDEALAHVDAVVVGEAETVWAEVLHDVREGTLQRRYHGVPADLKHAPAARNDLLSADYGFGAIQTTRGCPLSCNFCSVTAFNGAQYRRRPIDDVVRELETVREKLVLIVDDNLIGTRSDHIARAKELFRAIAQRKLGKKWVAQVTINFADDEELLALAAKAGCRGVFIGFESPDPAGLLEIGKRFNMTKGRDFRASVRRIQRHGILVMGSFIIGLDVDTPGIGRRIAAAASSYGLDNLNVLFLTPLPGTRLWDQMESSGRLPLRTFPRDWSYFTLTFPVVRYNNFSTDTAIEEIVACNRMFYSAGKIVRRFCRSLWQRRNPLISLIGSLSYRRNLRLECDQYEQYSERHPAWANAQAAPAVETADAS